VQRKYYPSLRKRPGEGRRWEKRVSKRRQALTHLSISPYLKGRRKNIFASSCKERMRRLREGRAEEKREKEGGEREKKKHPLHPRKKGKESAASVFAATGRSLKGERKRGGRERKGGGRRKAPFSISILKGGKQKRRRKGMKIKEKKKACWFSSSDFPAH